MAVCLTKPIEEDVMPEVKQKIKSAKIAVASKSAKGIELEVQHIDNSLAIVDEAKMQECAKYLADNMNSVNELVMRDCYKQVKKAYKRIKRRSRLCLIRPLFGASIPVLGVILCRVLTPLLSQEMLGEYLYAAINKLSLAFLPIGVGISVILWFFVFTHRYMYD